MRKVLFATILASLIIVCLQAIWICNAYRSYATEQLMNTNEILNSSIGQELINRQKNDFSNLKRHKLSATTMSAPSPEYIKKHKTEIIDLSSNKLGKNKTIAEAIQQYSQDIETYKHNPLKLTVLDSIFKTQIRTGNKYESLNLKKYCIISYRKPAPKSLLGNLHRLVSYRHQRITIYPCKSRNPDFRFLTQNDWSVNWISCDDIYSIGMYCISIDCDKKKRQAIWRAREKCERYNSWP